jgi:acetoin utilization protein AcuB
MSRMPAVRSVMTTFPYFVGLDDSLLRARAMMVEHGVRHLPVKDGDDLVGVLTDRDLKRAMDPDLGLPPKEELFVRDVAVQGAYQVDSSEPLDRVLERMAADHLGSALVTLHGRLAGIFTTTDACRAYCAHLRTVFLPPSGDEAA